MARKTTKPSKSLSGGARMKAAGLKAILVGYNAEDLAVLERAAAIEGRTLTNFTHFHTMQAAKRVVQENDE